MQAVQVKYGGGFLNDELVLWKKQKEYARYKKCQEQKQVRDMMENYWPWEDNAQVKPRGLKNLRLDGLFPQRDFENAKRFSGILDLGRPGGGAPNVNRDTGRKLLKTREDPLLRFQWGKDLRNTVDNKLRYHTDKSQQEKYRKELDRMVEEKINEKLQEKTRNDAGNKIAKRPAKNREFPETEKWISKRYQRLSPLHNGKDLGIELVPLMIQKRTSPKIPLGTTDVTRNGEECTNAQQWNESQLYLKALLKQMSGKRRCLQETNSSDLEGSMKHFETWSKIWGRPGHGAPRSSLRKGCIEKMLYPKMIPIA